MYSMQTLQSRRNRLSLAEIEQGDSLDQRVKKIILSEKKRIPWHIFTFGSTVVNRLALPLKNISLFSQGLRPVEERV